VRAKTRPGVSRSTWVIAFWLLVTLAGGALFLGRFSLDNSVGVWFPENDPALAGYEEFLDTFGPWEWTLVLLTSDGPPGPRLLRDVDDLGRRLERDPGVRQAVGPVTLAALDPESAGRAFASGPPWRVPLLLETTNEIHRGDEFRRELLRRIDGAAASCPGVRSHTVVGTSVINVALNTSARRDMVVFFSLVFVLLAGVSRLMLRSWRDAAVLLAVASGAVTATLGLVAACGVAFNILTIMMPTLLIALSTANLVHLTHAFHEHLARGMSPAEAAREAVREVRLPALGTTLTTAIGFLSLAVSDMPPVRQLALFSAAGVLLAWASTLTVAPVLLARVPRRRAALSLAPRARTALLERWGRRVPRLGARLLLPVLAASPLLFGLTRLHTDTNYMEFFRHGSATRDAYQEVARSGFAQSEVDLMVRAPRPLRAGELAPFLAAVRSAPGVRGVLDPSVPGLRHFTTEDERASRITVFTEFLGAEGTGALADSIAALGSALLPADARVLVTGSPVLWQRMDAGITRTQKNSLVLVALGTLVLLALLFRDVKATVVGWVGSALPVGLILGVMGWLGVPVTLATVLIAGIALGLAVDDTVHFVITFRRRVARGAAREDAIREAMVAVGERMIASSLILAGSFSVMAFSDFVPTADFGVFTALTILLALAADLTLVPGLIGLDLRFRPTEPAFTPLNNPVHAPDRNPGSPASEASPLRSRN